MNRNNSDNNTEAVKIANALKPFAKKWFDEWGQSCVRSKKMTVSTPPNGSVIGVKDAFSDTEVFIKYMSSCSNAVAGDTVWCKWMYDNMQTLYADEIGNLRQPTTVFGNSSSGDYAKVLTFSTDVHTSANLLPPMVDGTYSGNGVTAVVSGGVATLSGTTTASGNAIIIPLTKSVVVPDNSYIHLFNSVANGSAAPSFELSTSLSTTSIAPSMNPANRIYSVPSNRYGVTIDRVRFWLSSGVTLSGTFNPMLAMSSTAIPFEPYVDASDLNINAPITLEYVKTGDVSPTTLTIVFNRDYSLNSYTKNASADAYLVNSSTAHWDLYIGKNNSSDSVNVLDFHNPWSNTDMVVEWANSAISTLPTGYVSATPVNTVISVSPSGVSVASGSWKTVASITLPRGIWILSGYTQYNSNSTGIRSTVLSESQDDGTSTRNMSSDLNNNTGNNTSKLHFVDIYQIASEVTYYLNAYQNSGSAITTYGRMVAIKIV